MFTAAVTVNDADHADQLHIRFVHGHPIICVLHLPIPPLVTEKKLLTSKQDELVIVCSQ